MIKTFILSFIMMLSLSFSSNEKISGYVYDKNTKEHLCGVRIIVGTDTTYSNFDGYFQIKNSNNLKKIKLSLISYKKIELIHLNNKLVISEMIK